MSPLSSVVFTDHYGAGNLESSLCLESDTTNYPPATLQSPDLANYKMPRTGTVVMLHEDASNAFLTTVMTNMDDVQINLKSRSMPNINWTPLFTDHASAIKIRDGRFYLRIQSRLKFDFNGEETSCEGTIPI
jgi:hypothetical protein